MVEFRRRFGRVGDILRWTVGRQEVKDESDEKGEDGRTLSF